MPEQDPPTPQSDPHFEAMVNTWSMLKYSQLMGRLGPRDRYEVDAAFDHLIDETTSIRILLLDEDFTFTVEDCLGNTLDRQSDDFLIELNEPFKAWLYRVRSGWRVLKMASWAAVSMEEISTLDLEATSARYYKALQQARVTLHRFGLDSPF